MQTIDKFNFAGKKAIVRVDFNVPLNKETGAVSEIGRASCRERVCVPV